MLASGVPAVVALEEIVDIVLVSHLEGLEGLAAVVDGELGGAGADHQGPLVGADDIVMHGVAGVLSGLVLPFDPLDAAGEFAVYHRIDGGGAAAVVA